MKKILLKKYVAYIFSICLLTYFTITGTDCEKVLTGGEPSVPSEIIGNWKLIEQTGALQDICPDETVDYLTTGVAQLTCPGGSTINRNFTVENDILTYPETAVSYDIEFISGQTEQIILRGRNVSRNLTYEKIIADNSPEVSNPNSTSVNSSEERR